MSRCPACDKEWPGHLRICPDDHTPLQSERPTAVAGRPGSAKPEPAEAAPTVELAPGTRIGEFEIEGRIGAGGMATVYSAVHPLIGKRAAIKVINPLLSRHPIAVERFVQEARAVNQIGHPNIVDVFSLGQLPDGRSYLAMEWLSGQTLGERMEEGGFALTEAIEIVDQIAEALQAAHDHQVLHRDLKPDNVFIESTGERDLVKLLDFGIAKLVDPEHGGTSRTQTGMMLGTPDYMSPEQARGHEVGPATDVYSLGVVCFEMLAGRLPFDADNAADMIAKHLSHTPPRVGTMWADVPPSIDDIVARMLAKPPDERPELAELRAVLAEVYRSELTHLEQTDPGALHTPSVAALRRGVLTPTPSTTPGRTTPPPSAAVSVEEQSVVGGTEDTMLAKPQPKPPAAAPRRRRGLWAALLGAAVVGAIAAAVLPRMAERAGETLGLTSEPDAAPRGDADTAIAAAADDADAAPPARVAADEAVPPDAAPPAPEPATAKRPPSRGTLVVRANVRARFVVDGKVKARRARRVRVRTTAGLHTIKVTAPGRRPVVRKVRVASGKLKTVSVALKKTPRKKRKRRRKRRRRRR